MWSDCCCCCRNSIWFKRIKCQWTINQNSVSKLFASNSIQRSLGVYGVRCVASESFHHIVISKWAGSCNPIKTKKKMCKDNCMNVCASWQQWIKALLVLTYVLFVLVALPWLILYTVRDGLTRKDQLLLIGGIFVLASLPLSFWHILQHMLHFTKPILQKPIIRILWMVPIYSGNAVISSFIIVFFHSTYSYCIAIESYT